MAGLGQFNRFQVVSALGEGQAAASHVPRSFFRDSYWNAYDSTVNANAVQEPPVSAPAQPANPGEIEEA